MEYFEVKQRLLLDDGMQAKIVAMAFEQWLKDTRLAGISIESTKKPITVDEFVAEVKCFIEGAKNSNPNWENLNYTIDLPEEVMVSTLSYHQYAELIAKRMLLKVWVRYSNSKLSLSD